MSASYIVGQPDSINITNEDMFDNIGKSPDINEKTEQNR